MAKKGTQPPAEPAAKTPARGGGRPSALLDTRVIYCGDNLEQLAKLPDRFVDLIYIDPPFNSNRRRAAYSKMSPYPVPSLTRSSHW